MAVHEFIKLYRLGYKDLVPLEGKACYMTGWTTHETTEAEVQGWINERKNVGLRSKNFPGIDGDITQPNISLKIRIIAREVFGTKCPIRMGKAPKWLLVTRATGSIKKQKLTFSNEEQEHSIEILADGQQYVVPPSIHPDINKPYMWEERPGSLAMMNPEDIPEITQAKIDEFFDRVRAYLGESWTVEQSGVRNTAAPVTTQDLLAPNMDLLASAVAKIPNDADTDRDVYVAMAHAIKAATPEEEDFDGFGIFSEWASRWGDADEAEDTRQWETLVRSNITVGWGYLRMLAERQGWDGRPAASIDAQIDFEPIAGASPDPTDETMTLNASMDDGQVLDYIIDRIDDIITTGKNDWFLWDSKRWAPDELKGGHAMDRTAPRLRALADDLRAKYPQGGEQKGALEKQLNKLRSIGYLTSVFGRVGADFRLYKRRNALNSEAVGHLLCTPGGTHDLETGTKHKHRQRDYITQITGVDPAFRAGLEEFNRFIRTSCGDDESLVAYVRAVLGSAITTDNQDRLIWFLTGASGAGKSTLLKHVHAVLGEYAGIVPQGAFIHGDKQAHESAIAGMRDKRFLHGSEIDRGHKWNVALLKSITGNEPITARRLYHDYEEFNVVGKVIIAGNETPTLPNVDSAVKNRLRIIPFQAPEKPDPDLDAKLRAEHPAILAWIIEGARLWHREGYPKCDLVERLTEEYFDSEDLVTQFRDSHFLVTGNEKAFVATSNIEQLWNQFTSPEQRHEYGLRNSKTLIKAIVATDLRRLKKDRRAGHRGLSGMEMREGSEVKLKVDELL